MWTLKKLTVILVIMTSYSSYGAGGPVFDETQTIVSAVTVKEQTYDCPECSKSFLRKGQLNRHKRTHTNERPYVCSKCGYAFSQKSTLTAHMLTHTGKRPYACSECSMKFSRKGNLNVHIRTHTGERPYTCSECGKAFLTKCDLTTHMRTHTGERPYACSECSKAFSRKDHLDRHVMLVHKPMQVKKEEFEHPDVLDEKLKSIATSTAAVLDLDPKVLEKIWGTVAAAKTSAVSQDLD